jgi:hypothetical protein
MDISVRVELLSKQSSIVCSGRERSILVQEAGTWRLVGLATELHGVPAKRGGWSGGRVVSAGATLQLRRRAT